LIGGSDPAASVVAIESLSRRQSAKALPALFQAAGQGNADVRLAAVKALGKLAAVTHVPQMISLLLRAESGADLEAAEGALISICGGISQPDACASMLAQPMSQADPKHKKALLRALEAVGGSRALEAVRRAAADPDATVRDTAVGALCNWSSPEAAPDLIKIAKSGENSTHRLLALRGLIRLANDESVPAERRLAWCADSQPLITRDDERRQWLGALGSIPSPQALSLIAPRIGDSAVNEEACSAAVAVARKLLTKPEASAAEFKPNLAGIADVLDRARQSTGNAQLKADVLGLLAKIKELQGRAGAPET
jgi:HEAT repeat protein